MENRTLYFRKGMFWIGIVLIILARLLEIFFHLISPLATIIQVITVLICCMLFMMFLIEPTFLYVGAFIVVGTLYVFGLNICEIIRAIGILLKERYS